jgi:hypothetical protein
MLQYFWKHGKTSLKSSILMAVWIFISFYSPDCPYSPELKIPTRNVDRVTPFYFHRIDLNSSVLYYIFFFKKGHEMSSFLCELVNFWCVIPNNRTFTYYYASMLSHHVLANGQSSYWTVQSSFLFLASNHTAADPNYTLGVNFWIMIFYNLKTPG